MTRQPVASVVDPVIVGRLTSSYGVRGWIKVHSYTDPMENFLGYRQLFTQQQGQWLPLAVEEGKLHGKGLVVKLHGVDTPEQARLYSGVDVAIDAGELPLLDADEYYWHQLQGLKVLVAPMAAEQRAAEPRLLGRVDHLLETGANDVLVVTPCEGSIDERERLIPYLPDDVVKRIDLAAGTLLVEWDPEF